jgi:hypothetical protein
MMGLALLGPSLAAAQRPSSLRGAFTTGGGTAVAASAAPTNSATGEIRLGNVRVTIGVKVEEIDEDNGGGLFKIAAALPVEEKDAASSSDPLGTDTPQSTLYHNSDPSGVLESADGVEIPSTTSTPLPKAPLRRDALDSLKEPWAPIPADATGALARAHVAGPHTPLSTGTPAKSEGEEHAAPETALRAALGHALDNDAFWDQVAVLAFCKARCCFGSYGWHTIDVGRGLRKQGSLLSGAGGSV